MTEKILEKIFNSTDEDLSAEDLDLALHNLRGNLSPLRASHRLLTFPLELSEKERLQLAEGVAQSLKVFADLIDRIESAWLKSAKNK